MVFILENVVISVYLYISILDRNIGLCHTNPCISPMQLYLSTCWQLTARLMINHRPMVDIIGEEQL